MVNVRVRCIQSGVARHEKRGAPARSLQLSGGVGLSDTTGTNIERSDGGGRRRQPLTRTAPVAIGDEVIGLLVALRNELSGLITHYAPRG